MVPGEVVVPIAAAMGNDMKGINNDIYVKELEEAAELQLQKASKFEAKLKEAKKEIHELRRGSQIVEFQAQHQLEKVT